MALCFSSKNDVSMMVVHKCMKELYEGRNIVSCRAV